MMLNKSLYIISILTKPIIINYINKRSMTTLRNSVIISSKICVTYLIVPIKLTISKRFMWSRNRGNIGHANKVLNATNKPPVQATATTFPSNVNKVEEELEANRKLPTGIDFSNNATDQTSTRGYGSSSQNNSGPLGTHNPNHRTTLNTENSRSVPHTTTRGYASVHGGKYTEPLPKVVPTLKPTLQEETHTETSVHKVIGIVRCKSNDCLKVDCANNETNPCDIPPETHQKEFSQEELDKHKLVLQSAGNTTTSNSTKLPDKQVIVIDPYINYSDQKKPQHGVIEQATVPLDAAKYSEEARITYYFQNPDRSAKILTAIEANTQDEAID